MSQMIIFTFGYFLGGLTALVLMGLAVAARRSDMRPDDRGLLPRGDDATPAWRERL